MNKSIKILSIEDDEFMRIFLKDVFWIHGMKGDDNFEFSIVGDFKKAREILSDPANRPDVILLDLMMADKEGGMVDREAGFHFLEELKGAEKTKGIKIIIFSGFSDKEIKEKAEKLGADKFLVKGEYMPTELIRAIHEIAKK
ncbi:MAG: response regulator [Candidatus Paceibacterota bacterium]